MPKRTCSVDGCERPHDSNGYCGVHMKRLRRRGTTDKPSRTRPPKPCSADGCDRPSYCKSLCSLHYQRLRFMGDLDLSRKPHRSTPDRTCAINGCPNPHKARGWCSAHYQRWRKLGDPLGVAPPRQRDVPATKLCTACGVVKDRSEFTPRAGRGPGAVMATCRPCSSRIAAAWARANPEKVRARAKPDPEKRRESVRRWWSNPANRATINEIARRKDRAKLRAKDARRRARARRTMIGPVDYSVIFEAHAGICGICGSAVDPSNYHMDHIIALANGGTHTADNLQPSHPRCNQKKGARPWPPPLTSSAQEVSADPT